MKVNIFFLALAIAIIVDRVIAVYFKFNLTGARFMGQIEKLVVSDNIDKAVKLCNAAPKAALARVLRAGLTRANRGVLEIGNAIEEESLAVTPAIMTRVPALWSLSNIAVLVGLFGTMRAMKAGAIGLRNGKVLNIYPEGERAFDGNLHDFKKGAAILSTELGLPIVPVALDGLHKIWPRNSWRIRPGKVKITIGEPFYANDVLSEVESAKVKQIARSAGSAASETVIKGSPMTDEERYEAVTAHLKQTIASMIDEMRK